MRSSVHSSARMQVVGLVAVVPRRWLPRSRSAPRSAARPAARASTHRPATRAGRARRAAGGAPDAAQRLPPAVASTKTTPSTVDISSAARSASTAAGVEERQVGGEQRDGSPWPPRSPSSASVADLGERGQAGGGGRHGPAAGRLLGHPHHAARQRQVGGPDDDRDVRVGDRVEYPLQHRSTVDGEHRLARPAQAATGSAGEDHRRIPPAEYPVHGVARYPPARRSIMGSMARVTIRRTVLRVDTAAGPPQRRPDTLVAEEPLEIRVGRAAGGQFARSALAVTMRTPGNDLDLALGFLLTEGVIGTADDVRTARLCAGTDAPNTYNVVGRGAGRRGTGAGHRPDPQLLHHQLLWRVRKGEHRRGAHPVPVPGRRRRGADRCRYPAGPARQACGRRSRPSRRPVGCTRPDCSQWTVGWSSRGRMSGGTTRSTRWSAGRSRSAGYR